MGQHLPEIVADAASEPNVSQITPADVISSEAAVINAVGGQADFGNEVASINRSLGEVEGRRFPETNSLAPVRDSWRHDIAAAFNEINRLEKSWPAGQDSPSTLNSSIGETR